MVEHRRVLGRVVDGGSGLKEVQVVPTLGHRQPESNGPVKLRRMHDSAPGPLIKNVLSEDPGKGFRASWGQPQ
jgi:hypothetical protein